MAKRLVDPEFRDEWYSSSSSSIDPGISLEVVSIPSDSDSSDSDKSLGLFTFNGGSSLNEEEKRQIEAYREKEEEHVGKKRQRVFDREEEDEVLEGRRNMWRSYKEITQKKTVSEAGGEEYATRVIYRKQKDAPPAIFYMDIGRHFCPTSFLEELRSTLHSPDDLQVSYILEDGGESFDIRNDMDIGVWQDLSPWEITVRNY